VDWWIRGWVSPIPEWGELAGVHKMVKRCSSVPCVVGGICAVLWLGGASLNFCDVVRLGWLAWLVGNLRGYSATKVCSPLLAWLGCVLLLIQLG
jgi:hypothetical protein